MDVNEILGAVHATSRKRDTSSARQNGTSEEPRKSKFQKLNEDKAGETGQGNLPAGFFDAEVQEALDKLNSEPADERETLDETAVRRILSTFEKTVLKNSELRVKFADEPMKYLDSEFDLKEAIHKLNLLATQPDLYPVVLQMNFVQRIIQLLSHENTIISYATILLLEELTDAETLGESSQEASSFVEALLKDHVVVSLIQNLDRLDESFEDDADALFHTLGVVENILEFKPDSAEPIAKVGALKWLLRRINKNMQFDTNKQYASEILSILVQDSVENRKAVGEMNGVDILLRQLSVYKKKDPQSGDEVEMMENLFNCLNSVLLYAPNRKLFLDGEGIQLMILMLKEKRLSLVSAIKVLSFALTSDDDAEPLCNKFVEALGLGRLFPLFMLPPKQSHKRGGTKEDVEEHLCSTVSSLARNTTGDFRKRFLFKFEESEFEKVDRVIDLHRDYVAKVEQCDKEIARDLEEMEDVDEDTQDQMYLRRLDAGAFTLQKVDVLVLEIYSDAEVEVRNRINRVLSMQQVSRDSITKCVKEYMEEIKQEHGDVSKRRDYARLSVLMDRFQIDT